MIPDLARRWPRRAGAPATGLCGRDGGWMRGLAEPLLVVPCDETARIQELHIAVAHIVCELVEREVAAPVPVGAQE